MLVLLLLKESAARLTDSGSCGESVHVLLSNSAFTEQTQVFKMFFFFFSISITVFYIFGDLLPHHWILLCFLLFRANDVLPFNVESLERVILLLHFYWWHRCFCSSVLSSHLSQKQKTLWWRMKECGWTTVHVRVSKSAALDVWLTVLCKWVTGSGL